MTPMDQEPKMPIRHDIEEDNIHPKPEPWKLGIIPRVKGLITNLNSGGVLSYHPDWKEGDPFPIPASGSKIEGVTKLTLE
jgi:hypothetical protein